MTHPIIKTDNYILITSDEEILIGDVVLSKLNQIILFSKYYDPKLYKKVIAHLPLNNQPILEGVPLLPPLPNEEDDVEKLVNKYVQELVECKSVKESERTWISAICHQSIIKAKEKYKFTEEDMRKFFLAGKRFGMSQDKENQTMDFDKFKQVYSETKLPVGFKCRMELNPVNHAAGLKLTGNLIMDIAITQNYTPKIINGVMQGEWIFE